MQNFRLKGLAHPGRVNLYQIGTVELANISDKLAEEIYKSGCPYLEPTPEYRKILFPEEIPITVKDIDVAAQINKEAGNPATAKPVKGTRKKPSPKQR